MTDELIPRIVAEIVGNSPMFGVLLYMYWREHQERVAVQSELREVVRDYIRKLEELINGKDGA